MSTPDDIIRILDLEPLPGEGGWYRETYRALRRLGDRACSALLGCTVSPGFEWADFELATPDDVQALARRFPDHDTLVHALSP